MPTKDDTPRAVEPSYTDSKEGSRSSWVSRVLCCGNPDHKVSAPATDSAAKSAGVVPGAAKPSAGGSAARSATGSNVAAMNQMNQTNQMNALNAQNMATAATVGASTGGDGGGGATGGDGGGGGGVASYGGGYSSGGGGGGGGGGF